MVLHDVTEDLRANTLKKMCATDPISSFFPDLWSVDIAMLLMLCFPTFSPICVQWILLCYLCYVFVLISL